VLVITSTDARVRSPLLDIDIEIGDGVFRLYDGATEIDVWHDAV